jgi:hypothetical protein
MALIVTSTTDSTFSRCIGEGWADGVQEYTDVVQLLNGGLPLGPRETTGLTDAAVVGVFCAYALLANRPAGHHGRSHCRCLCHLSERLHI